MNPYTVFEARVRSLVAALASEGRLPPGPDLSRIVVEPPRDPTHGDLATNAALLLAKRRAGPRASSPASSPSGWAPTRRSRPSRWRVRASST